MNKHILFVIIFFFLSVSKVFGFNYFYDSFDFKDDTKWNYIQNSENVVYLNGIVNLEGNLNSDFYPLFINNQQNIFSEDKDWIINVKFQYKSTGNFGDGIGIGFTGPGGNLFYQFGIWNDVEKGSHFYYNDFSNRTNNCVNFSNVFDIVGRNYVIFNFLNNEWHNFRIEKIDRMYKVYLDENNIYNTDDNQCVPTHLWFGNKLRGGFGLWSLLSVDDVRIFDGVDEPVITPTSTPIPTPTQIPTPTPTPVVKKPKVIILPGLGASWNSEAIVYNANVGNDQWKMTPFVKNYDGLINGLKQNGLVKDENFYVWNYDWRKPLSEIVSNLDTFIDQKINPDEKVILIGHSLGGLTSRIWAEDNRNDTRLEKVVTLGSPHLGSVEAYEIWNGGQISDLTKFSSIAFKILLKIQGLNTKTDMEAVRRYVPLVKDLLPTFDFVKKNGVNLTNDKLETKNTFLKNKNDDGLNSGINLNLFVGKNYKTMNSVEIKNNSIFDKVLGIWPDGRISKFLYTNNGDDTVLTKSANYGGNNFVEIDSNHADIINKNINQVMMEIGLSQVNIATGSQDLSDSLVVFVGSPVDYSVKCDNEPPVLEDNGFVIIKNKNYKFCNINLVGNGNGLVHVVTGNTNNNNWSYWEKNITNGEVNNIKINPNDGEIINDKNSILFLKSMIKSDINSLLLLNKNNRDLREALKSLDKNQPRLLIKNVFDFRRKSNEVIVSQKIINNTTIWLSLIDNCSKNRPIIGFKIVNNYQKLIDRLINLKIKKGVKFNENVAISYQEMDDLLKINKSKIDKKDYSGVCANNFVALNYGSEVLFKSHGNESKKWLLEDSNL